MSSSTLHVVMIASPRMAYAFEQAISNAGLRASSDAPSQKHGDGDSIDTIRYEFEITGDEALLRPGILAAIQQLTERFPRAEFELEDEGEGDGEAE